MRRPPTRCTMLAVLAIVVAACGTTTTTTTSTTTSTSTSTSTATTTAGPETTTSTAPETTTTTTVAATGEFESGTYTSEGFPGGGQPAYLEDVTVESFHGFDRVVFVFRGDAEALTFEVRPASEPILESPSGNEIEVAGDTFFEVVMTPASGFEFVEDDVVETYAGDDRLAGPVDATALAEVVRTEDFENVMTWVVGIAGDGSYAHELEADAGRFVLDVATP